MFNGESRIFGPMSTGKAGDCVYRNEASHQTDILPRKDHGAKVLKPPESSWTEEHLCDLRLGKDFISDTNRRDTKEH